jgi:hypothetical protein
MLVRITATVFHTFPQAKSCFLTWLFKASFLSNPVSAEAETRRAFTITTANRHYSSQYLLLDILLPVNFNHRPWEPSCPFDLTLKIIAQYARSGRVARSEIVRHTMMKVMIDEDVQGTIDAYRVLTNECNPPWCLASTPRNVYWPIGNTKTRSRRGNRDYVYITYARGMRN